MVVWLKTGELDVGIAEGIVRADDFAALAQACELGRLAQARLDQAQERAADIVAQAQQDAQRQLEQARLECERLRAEAQAQGFREGAQQWAEELSRRAVEGHLSVQRASDRLADLVSLAAQRVVEVEDREGLYRRALRTVRSLSADSRSLVLHVGVDDEAHARTVIGQLSEETGIPVPLEIKVDARLGAGGCVLESDHGVVDASLGLQIDAVKRAIGRAARAALARADSAGGAG